MFFSAYAKTGVPVEAAKFVSYFINDPAATEVLGVERGVPESAAVREELSNTLDELGKAQIEYIENLGDLAGPLPPPPPTGAGEIAFALKRINEEVGFGTRAGGGRRDAGLRGHRDPGPGLSQWPRRTLQLRPPRRAQPEPLAPAGSPGPGPRTARATCSCCPG